MRLFTFIAAIVLIGGLVAYAGFLVSRTISNVRANANKRVEDIYEKKLLNDAIDDLSEKLRKAQRETQKGNS